MSAIAFLDGGLGQEINKRSNRSKSHPLWSIQVMIEFPEIVKAVHKEFILAGSRVVTANNYIATPLRLKEYGYGDKFFETHQLAFELLELAIAEVSEDFSNNIKLNVAGCLPPLVASYDASVALNEKESYDHYCNLVEAQINYADVFLVETMSNITEAKAAIAALKAAGEKCFVSLSISDDLSNNLRSGESLEQAIDILGSEGLDGLCLNCSRPETIDEALPLLKASDIRFGCYANAFKSVEALTPKTTVDILKSRNDMTISAYANFALGWAAEGATIIGGCCEISPEHIAFLHEALSNAGYQPTTLV